MPMCRQCGKKFKPRFRSTEKECSVECSMAWLKSEDGRKAQEVLREKKIRKANQERKAVEKSIRKARRDLKRNTLSWQHDRTQEAFNKMRRLQEIYWYLQQGKEPECISCGTTKGLMACGHFITRGSSSNLRYEEKNTALQCNKNCNSAKSGNRKGDKHSRGYENGLRDKHGRIVGNWIIEWCEREQHKVRYWTCEELEEMRKGFNAEARKLEKLIEALQIPETQ